VIGNYALLKLENQEEMEKLGHNLPQLNHDDIDIGVLTIPVISNKRESVI
jgi:hypothetical protein